MESRDTTPIRVFVSYSSQDDEHRINLEKHLRLLQRQGLVETWHDRKVFPGESWGSEIAEQLERADVILLLVSADFLASDYCYDIETRRALERHEAGDARVIPVIVDFCDWKNAPFAALQALPDRARPVTDWENGAEAWTDIAKGIRKVAAESALAQRREERQPAGPIRYLELLKEQNSFVEIRGMGARVSERMDLSQVYTRLLVSAPDTEDPTHRRKTKVRPEDELEDRLGVSAHRELRDVLSESPHAALVGDPGSGKTTYLRFVALNLARANLGETEALSELGLSGVSEEPSFPVLVRLERLARFLSDNPDETVADDAPEHFYRYLEHSVTGHALDLPSEYLRSRVLAGGCFLLLDGLDEVPGEPTRQRLVRLIEKVIIAGSSSGNRHLVTCRTRAYEGRVQLAGKISTFRLAPLGRAQVEQFVNGWCRALFRVQSGNRETPQAVAACDYGKELLAAIDDNPSGETFSENPLMLTVLAVVHWNKKKLPEQRAELYDNAIEYLLDSRRELSEHATTLRRECLQAVATAMFEDPEGVQRSYGRNDAADAVITVLGGDRRGGVEFLEQEELHSGVLVSRTEGEVEFWHLIFQEYLAALELSQADDGWDRVRERLADARWTEVILLLAGCERRQGGLRAARRLIQRILDAGQDAESQARTVALVSRVLRDIRPYGGNPEQGTDYERKLSDTLGIFEPDGPDVEEATRAQVGTALGQAGDPRFLDENANRVRIPGGTFWMGAQSEDLDGRNYDPDAHEDESPVHRVTVPDYLMGRYPVTVMEYKRFVDAAGEGYLNPRFWEPKGWSWREKQGLQEPRDWKEQVDCLNRAVTMVSWYEADAYCRWVHGRLPTEAEWEWVARGVEGRKYPWGDAEPSSRHANFAMNLGSPTPVGVYPLDQCPGGVRDLAGNVLEWCSDWFREYPTEDVADPRGSADGAYRVLRGGSFYDNPPDLRAAYRNYLPPEFKLGYFGFRVVWSLAGGQE